MKILWLLVICQIKTNIAIWGNFSPFFQFLYFRHELNQSRTTQVQSQQRYVNELESAKRTFEAQLHQEHESQKNLVVNLQGQVQFHMSRANSLQATIGTFFIAIFFFCNFAKSAADIIIATCAKKTSHFFVALKFLIWWFFWNCR